jgi:hypothetical protein
MVKVSLPTLAFGGRDKGQWSSLSDWPTAEAGNPTVGHELLACRSVCRNLKVGRPD